MSLREVRTPVSLRATKTARGGSLAQSRKQYTEISMNDYLEAREQQEGQIDESRNHKLVEEVFMSKERTTAAQRSEGQQYTFQILI